MLRYFCFLLLAARAFGESCSSEISCNENNPKSSTEIGRLTCTSHFGGFPQLGKKAQELATQHLQASMQFLMLSSRFSFWETERQGFQKLFEKLSDSVFDDAVTIIQQSARRGGVIHNLEVHMPVMKYDISEIEALGKALDFQKALANDTLHLIHFAASGNSGDGRNPDGEFAHFLTEEVGVRQGKVIHNLAGHVNSLGDAIAAARTIGKDPGFAIYMYDSQILD